MTTVAIVPLRDPDIRAVLPAWARERATGPFLLVGEVEVRGSRVPARLDALLISDRLVGFEIKSDVDSLARLPRQVQAFSPLLDEAVLVCGVRHAARAVEMVPDWWTVLTAERDTTGQVQLAVIREGGVNPKPRMLWLLRMLFRAELVAILRAHGVRGYTGLRVAGLRKLATASIPADQLRAAALGYLRTGRPWWSERALDSRTARVGDPK